MWSIVQANNLTDASYIWVGQRLVIPGTRTGPSRPSSRYKVAFTRYENGRHAIWTANLDGSEQKKVIDYAGSPDWTPDGRILFYGEEGVDHNPEMGGIGTNGVWVINSDASSPVQLLAEGSARYVSMSPDGKKVAFDAKRVGSRHIYVLRSDGEPLPYDFLGEQASWAPNSLQFVYRHCDYSLCGVWVANIDGSGAHRLTGGGGDAQPKWSPDGSKVVFTSDRAGSWDIYVINSNGTGLRRLTDDPAIDANPTWTPDSRQIVYRSSRSGEWGIWVMNADGSNNKQIVTYTNGVDEWGYETISAR
jgi:TolB protein